MKALTKERGAFIFGTVLLVALALVVLTRYRLHAAWGDKNIILEPAAGEAAPRAAVPKP